MTTKTRTMLDDDETPLPTGDVQAAIDAVTALHQPQLVSVTGFNDPRVLLAPEGFRVHDIEPFLAPYRQQPLRRKGTAQLLDRTTFIEHVNRFKDEHSAIFAKPDRTKPTLTAVYDYHEAGGPDAVYPRFGEHRAILSCETSPEWQAWIAQEGKPMAQGAFAAFLEDRIQDVVLANDETLAEQLGATVGGPSALMTLARGLAVSVATRVRNAVTLASGECAITFEEVHEDGSGAPIRTPTLFFLGIPVFYGGQTYQVPVRLRYRIQERQLSWSYHLHRPDKVFEHAFREVCDAVRTGTALPVFVGSPEA